mmetsp:Transcript_53111/g.137184  ORF Transcript_53111/g.137184 Transcript_53111/m.137184 type:complete len:377 (-) Transcript_53111:309-1439(-)
MACCLEFVGRVTKAEAAKAARPTAGESVAPMLLMDWQEYDRQDAAKTAAKAETADCSTQGPGMQRSASAAACTASEPENGRGLPRSVTFEGGKGVAAMVARLEEKTRRLEMIKSKSEERLARLEVLALEREKHMAHLEQKFMTHLLEEADELGPSMGKSKSLPLFTKSLSNASTAMPLSMTASTDSLASMLTQEASSGVNPSPAMLSTMLSALLQEEIGVSAFEESVKLSAPSSPEPRSKEDLDFTLAEVKTPSPTCGMSRSNFAPSTSPRSTLPEEAPTVPVYLADKLRNDYEIQKKLDAMHISANAQSCSGHDPRAAEDSVHGSASVSKPAPGGGFGEHGQLRGRPRVVLSPASPTPPAGWRLRHSVASILLVT